MYLRNDLRRFNLRELGSVFDVVLIEPPLEEYQRSRGMTNKDFWTWNQVGIVIS
jgi:mRNA (2'-O-methyladenosine-N6-)-methyltransferase